MPVAGQTVTRARDLPRLREETMRAWRAYAALNRARGRDPLQVARFIAASGGRGDLESLAVETDRSAVLLGAADLWWIAADMTGVALGPA